jgi:hypothetical protein
MAGPHDWAWPTTGSTPTGGTAQGIANIQAQAQAGKTDPKILADIGPEVGAGTIGSQPTTTFAGTGTPGTSQFMSDVSNQPYYTTETPSLTVDAGTYPAMLPEHKALTKPSKFMIANAVAAEMAQNPKHGLSAEGQEGFSPNTLGSIIATDSNGNPILDSSGNPIFTSYGEYITSTIQDQWDPENPTDITLPGAFSENIANWEDLAESENEYWKYNTPWGGGPDYGGRDLLGERRAWQEGLFYGPKVAQQKQMEQQGFFNTLGSKIRNPFLEAVGETLAINPEGKSGLYGKTMFHPQMRKPWGLEKEYATGVRSPLYQNRARGGIMSVWADRR